MEIKEVKRERAIELIAAALEDKTDEELSRLYSLEVDSIDVIRVGDSNYGGYQGAVASVNNIGLQERYRNLQGDGPSGFDFYQDTKWST